MGKAIPPGSRKGTENVDDTKPAMRDRLRNHRRSIGDAHNLELSDFDCRSLSVVTVWITVAERFLIDHYRPVWNKKIAGSVTTTQAQAGVNSRRACGTVCTQAGHGQKR